MCFTDTRCAVGADRGPVQMRSFFSCDGGLNIARLTLMISAIAGAIFSALGFLATGNPIALCLAASLGLIASATVPNGPTASPPRSRRTSDVFGTVYAPAPPPIAPLHAPWPQPISPPYYSTFFPASQPSAPPFVPDGSDAGETRVPMRGGTGLYPVIDGEQRVQINH